MKVLTYTSFKEHYDLCTEIHGSIAIHSCQVGLAQKDMILLSKASLIVYKAGKQTGVTNTEFIKFTYQRVLIQLMILMQRSRYQSYNKDRAGNHLKLKT